MTQPVSNFAKSKHAPPITTVPFSTNVKHTDKAKLITKRVEISKSNSMYTTRSGWFSKSATRLITQM